MNNSEEKLPENIETAGEEKTKESFKPMSKEQYIQNYKELTLQTLRQLSEEQKDAVPAMMIVYTNEMAQQAWDIKELRFCVYHLTMQMQAMAERLEKIETRRSKHSE